MRRAVTTSLAVLAVLALSGCGDDGEGDLDAFCATARRFAVDNPADALGAYDPANPQGSARLLRLAAGELEAWADDAPGDVRADVEVLTTSAEDLAEAFEAPTVDAALVAELERGTAEVQAASARVTEAARAQCSVELDAPPPATTG